MTLPIVLLIWNVILTILISGILILNATKKTDDSSVTKTYETYDIVCEESHYYGRGCGIYGMYPELQERIVTIKEAVEILYRKLGLRIEYVPEKIETKGEELKAV